MDGISEAIGIYHKRREFYKSIDVRMALLKHEEAWYNVRTKLLLSCEKATRKIQRKVDIGTFVILQGSMDAEDFPTMLENVDRDEAEMDGIKIKFFADQPHQLVLEDWYEKNSDRAKERWNISWPLNVFKWEVSQKFQNEAQRILSKVGDRLNCYDPPYEDAYKAVRELLGLHEYEFRDYDGGRYSMSYVLFPDYIAVDNFRLQGRRLDFEVKMHQSINPSDVRLNLIERGKTIRKRQETLNRNQMHVHGNFRSARISLGLDDLADVQLYLFLKGKEADGPSDKKYFRNPKITLNSRFMANDVFEADAEKLTAWLHGEGKRSSEDFEHAVTVLFHLCGFSAEWLDRGNLAKDAPDILIFSAEPQALIVGECKVDVFTWKEMRKLKTRAMRLFKKIGIDTYPAMFTSVKESDIEQQTREKAVNENIAILTFEKMDEILNMALRGSGPAEVLTHYFQYGLTARSTS